MFKAIIPSLSSARVTNKRYPLAAVVVVKAKGMKDAWFLATSLGQPASNIVKLDGRRFTIEEGFRDAKDWRFGMGLTAARIGSPDRRDRLLLVSAMAVALLTLLGAAAEASERSHSFAVHSGRLLLRRATHEEGRAGPVAHAEFR